LTTPALDTSPPIDGGEEWRELSKAGSFLSLRRGERWLGEAETEWGKAVVKCAAADK
jgi:hypothetical protein